jgi:hypothetical protein
VREQETGATALIVAMVMVVIAGIAALTVDIGLAMNERRQDQAAADVGSLAALQFAQPDPGCSGSGCADQAQAKGAAAAIDVANASLDDPTLANWSDPALCGAPPSGFNLSTVSPCVAFTGNFQRAWVKIPTIPSPTSFGRLLGGDEVPVSASSIADQDFVNSGAVLPFLLPFSASGTNYNCLKTGPNPSWGVCEDLPSSGNFGSMDFFLYGNSARNTSQQCSGDTNGRLVSNISRGVDHALGKHPTGSGPGIEETANCPNLGAEPDMAQGQSGVGSALEAGLVYGGTAHSLDGSSYDGRIEDGSGVRVRRSGGGGPEVRVDNAPLWSYLSYTSGACSGVNTPAEMLTCIAWAKSNNTEIFDDSIVDAARFGFTPEVAEFDFLTPGSYYHIIGYRPVYIDTTYYGCNSSGCGIVHTPGVSDTGICPPVPEFVTCGTAGRSTDGLVAVTAYVLSAGILPEVAQTPGPGQEGQRRYNLSG